MDPSDPESNAEAGQEVREPAPPTTRRKGVRKKAAEPKATRDVAPGQQIAVQTDHAAGSLLPPKARESKADRDLRHFKDKWRFFVQDIAPTVLALVIAAVVVCHSLFVLTWTETPEDEKQRASAWVTTILASVLSFVFGRASKGGD
jgi:hypothetical protein